ncbi:MAG: hypothetical protein ACI89D_001919 [Bermanella sp.]|jgi:hypothetical protein
MKILIAFLCSLVITGCSVSKVEPWDRQYLAKPEMAWDPDSNTASYRSHVYFSKEASSGGASAGAGGCGCN